MASVAVPVLVWKLIDDGDVMIIIKWLFRDQSTGDYSSNFVLVFRFLLRMTSISWCIRVLKIGGKKRKNINLCEIDPSSFYAVISHCQCQSALERKICSCKKKITHSLGATQWTKIMKKVQFNVFFISSQSFFLVNKEIKKQDYFYRPIFIALFFPL